MKIGITGSRGFIGKNLCSHLKKEKISFVEINNDNIEILDDLTHIIHLAARTSLQESWENIPVFIEDNVTYTAQILELAKKLKASVIVCSTYGINPDQKKFSSPYHMTKSFSEQVAKFSSDNFSIPVTILRLANVYGLGQKDTFLIPTIINQIVNEDVKKIMVNDLSPLRSYVDVRDVIDSILMTVRKKQKSLFSTFFVGAKDLFSVEDLIQRALFISRVKKTYGQRNLVRKNEINMSSFLSQCDVLPGWFPKYSIDDGLKFLLDEQLQKNAK